MTTPQDPDNRPPSHMPPPPPLSESELAHGAQSGYSGGHRGPAVPEPKEVRLSFWLWVAGAVLLVLSSLLVLAQRDEAIKAARDAGGTQGLTEEQFVSTVTATLVFLVVVGVVLAVLMVFFAVKARSGRGWARTSLAVLGALVFLFHLFAFSLLGLLIILVVAGGVATLYLPAAKHYFDSVKRAG